MHTGSKVGFYAGYAWYKVDLYDDPSSPPPDYEDSGTAILLGADVLLWKESIMKLYLQGGIAAEKFKSTYLTNNGVETENEIVPQFGFLFSVSKFNAYAGLGATNFNIGLGLNL